MPLASDYPFLDVLGTMLVFFGFVIWVWMLFAVFGDLFRRHDVSGWGKAGWTLLVFIIPLAGTLIYLLAHGRGMAERNAAAQREAKAQLDQYVRETAGAEGPSAEIAKAKQLLDSGAIDQAEYERLKQRALG